MAKCKMCGKWGLFLKLQDGLCPKCSIISAPKGEPVCANEPSSNIETVPAADPAAIDEAPAPIVTEVPVQHEPAKPEPPQPKTYRVAGIQHHMDNLMNLAVPNDDYALSKRDLIDMDLTDERIWEHIFCASTAELVPEPDNPHDPKAIKVVAGGEHIGYIKAGSCAHLLKVLRENRIQKITCDIGGGPYKKIVEDYDYDKDKEIYTLERGTAPYFATLYITEA